MALISVATSLNSTLTGVATSLGLDGWQLSDGKYNGCSFAVFVPPILSDLPIYQSGVDIVANINQYLGGDNTGLDANRTGQLYNTFLGVVSFSDKLITGTVQKQTPYANSINIEDMGFKGYEFRMSLLFVGADYQKALSNFENAIKNPPTAPDKYLKLQHPTRGLIDGYTYVVGEPEIVYSVSLWRGAIVNVIFRSVTTPTTTKLPIVGTAQNIIRSVNSVLNAVTSISATIAIVNAQIRGLLNLFQTPPRNAENASYQALTATKAAAMTKSLTTTSNKIFNCTCYMYQKGTPGVSIIELDKPNIDYTYLPKSLNQSQRYNINQSSIIMEYYYAASQESVALIESLGLGGAANDIINEINTSVSKLAAVCESIGNKITYNTFIVPYIMSIRRIMSLNNIPLSNMSQMMSINPDILCGNYILSGTVVNLL